MALTFQEFQSIPKKIFTPKIYCLENSIHSELLQGILKVEAKGDPATI